MNNKLFGLGVATVLVTATSSLAGGASLTLLDQGLATDVTIDSLGITRVLGNSVSLNGPVNIYESFAGSTFFGTYIGDGFGWAMSAEGTEVAGIWTNPEGDMVAARWTESGGWESLGNLGATGGGSCDNSTAYGISADGETVVGLSWADVCSARAFLWTSETGMEALDNSGNRNNRASSISADGSTVAGFGQSFARSPSVWSADGSVIYFDEETAGEFMGVTPDGSTVVGSSDGPAVYWNACEGIVPIGTLAGNTAAQAHDISADGTRIVGTSGTVFEGYRAFIWTPNIGMVSLQQLLIDLGVSIPEGVVLEFANAISADGTVIVGRAFDPSIGGIFPYRSFVATLPDPVPDPCPADLDGDGQVGFTDLTQLLGGWGPCACPTACPEDLDGDGQVGFTDLTELLGSWGPCA